MGSTKLLLRPNPLPSVIFSPPIHSLFAKPKFTAPVTLSTFSTAAISAASGNHQSSLPYGPSLFKGKTPPTLKQQQDQQENETKAFIDETHFTRIFDIAALRVPAKDCYALESRLRGHLLNWPRVRNIARVLGDEIETQFVKLLGNNNDGSHGGNEDFSGVVGDEVNSVLFREELVKSFDARGFVKFRNLARISRLRRKKGKEKKEGKEGNGRKGELYVVEVVEEERKEMSGLLGDEFRGGEKWRGSTRLLLLDEELVDKNVEEFPEAIKVLLEQDTRENTTPTLELVKCRLTLFYDYWLMNEILEALLPKGMIIPSAFETVGHIAHLNLREEHQPFKYLIAKVVLDKNKPKIQTVVNKIDAIHNDYRTMQLEVLAGNNSLVTMLVENGFRFNVDLATVYWNSKLATERQRLLSGFNFKDVVCDVFAGVGPICIPAAKIVKRVYANDLNPYAVDYLERNSVLNKLEKKIEVFNMDGRRFIDAMFASQKAHKITQVVMNLPNDATEFLDAFRGIYRDRPEDAKFTFPKIHLYGFSKARDPEFDFHERIRIALAEVAVNVEMRRVRLVAPGKWMLCASFVLPESVAFARRSPNIYTLLLELS
ncbi:tRNA (guanine(37)-N1)-methyltransferase 2 [Citrus sinensis]|uniref:tRNA (Guanine(37)-N1)-methyltransferase 2 n=1 Tax=Citrus sinensis TaxID=2711 RepID=A0ACB8NY16_CITSI|nr:tRNA (guanine(37)-N1)-methyltransferase 2 [Citrus sinensis]